MIRRFVQELQTLHHGALRCRGDPLESPTEVGGQLSAACRGLKQHLVCPVDGLSNGFLRIVVACQLSQLSLLQLERPPVFCS